MKTWKMTIDIEAETLDEAQELAYDIAAAASEANESGEFTAHAVVIDGEVGVDLVEVVGG
jgi:hypothetical protein